MILFWSDARLPVAELDGVAERFGDPDHRRQSGGFDLPVQPLIQGRIAKAPRPASQALTDFSEHCAFHFVRRGQA